MWVFFEQYFGSCHPLKKFMIKMIGEDLKRWDIATLPRVDEFVAISKTIEDRIRDVYHRGSTVIYPPVEIDKFRFDPARKRGDYYVCVSALVPYKKVDIMIEAFNRMPDKKLVIVGDGNVRKEWEAKRVSSNIKFTGWVGHDEVVDICKGAKAFLFAAFEDFGIAPVEAQALGLPVIAYGVGGTTETVIPINGPSGSANPTGLFFFEQSADPLIGAVGEFERREGEFNPLDCRKNAERFSEDKFVNNIKDFVNEKTGLLRPPSAGSQ
jgi:glycosyltransferase involved in cell wall biosynthesis